MPAGPTRLMIGASAILVSVPVKAAVPLSLSLRMPRSSDSARSGRAANDSVLLARCRAECPVPTDASAGKYLNSNSNQVSMGTPQPKGWKLHNEVRRAVLR